MSRKIKPTRDRILEAAAKLFQREGVRAVSLDAIAAKADVTKRTIYYHFRSKDDLIAACLEARDQPNLILFKQWFNDAEGDLGDKVRAIFDQLARAAKHPKWKGCGFLRTSVELVNLPGHPALVVGRAHKKRVEDWLCSLLADNHCEDPRGIARQIILLMDGAFSVVLLHRDPTYFGTAGNAATSLIKASSFSLRSR